MQSLQLAGTTIPAGGLNTTYGLFFEFHGHGDGHCCKPGHDADLR